MSCGYRRWSPTPVDLSRFMCSLNLAECSFSLTDVSDVVITCDVVDSPKLVFFWCLIFRVNYHRTKGV